jgi:hypothetical protein
MIRVQKAKPLDKYKVWIEFTNGEQKILDLEPYLRGPIFEPIRSDPEVFRSVSVDPELKTLVWPNGADIDPDVLYGIHAPAWMTTEETVS